MVVIAVGTSPWSAMAMENTTAAQATTTTVVSPTTTSTTTTTAPPVTTVPTAPPRPPPRPAPAPPPAPIPPAPLEEPLPPAGGDGTAVPTEERGPFPADLQALTDSVRRTGSRNTQVLIDALAPLGQYGMSPEEAAVVGFGRFPVAGQANYSHDWWFPRFGPEWRLHEGTDIFAPAGTPVRAPADGRARIRDGGLGGLSVYVIEPDGTYYFLAHLAGTAADLVDGGPVRTGQVVGFTGDSGNAAGGVPHVHFEVHPRGGGPIDPKAVLDQFLADAVAGAPAIIDAYAKAAPAAGGVRPAIPEPRPARLALAGAQRSALLWASATSPAGGALRLAQAEALRVASTVERDRRSVTRPAAESERTDAPKRQCWHPSCRGRWSSVLG
ncbi:hypothetical protein BH24ACT1_BH24ACT1_09440 [soil metagenome]